MNRNSFEVKIDIKDDDGLKKLLRECEEATKQGLIDGTTELVLYIDNEKIIYTGKREGRWLFCTNEEGWARYQRCSICGEKELGKPPYCWNCGAKMEARDYPKYADIETRKKIREEGWLWTK